MLKKTFDFIIILVIWTALTWSFDTPDIFAGIFVSLILMFLFGDLFPKEITKLIDPRRFIWVMLYTPVFLWHVVKSNLDVAYRVFHPEMPIKPGIIKVKTSLKSEVARTFLANSITLTPGTLTVDCIEDYLYIHWINIISDDPEIETKMIVEKFEKFLKKIFE